MFDHNIQPPVTPDTPAIEPTTGRSPAGLISMITGLLGFPSAAVTCCCLPAWCVGFVLGVIAVVAGHRGLREYKQSDDQTGRAFALIGLIFGYLTLLIGIAYLALMIYAMITDEPGSPWEFDYPNWNILPGP